MINTYLAVIMKDERDLASFDAFDSIAVMEKSGDDWRVSKRFYVNFEGGGIADVRKNVRQIADALGTCRILVGTQVSGLAYNEFHRLGFSIFESPDIARDTLDAIVSDVARAEESAHSAAFKVPEYPVETDVPGVYALDLIRLQEARPDVSSKKALQDFLASTTFFELHLRCAHVPPWLEADCYYEVKTTPADGGGLDAVVRKSNCVR